MKKNFDKLNNTRYPGINIARIWAGETFGDTEIQKNAAAVKTNAEAVSHELAKVFRQTGMSEAEIRAWNERLKESSTPAQQQGIIEEAVTLMEGRLNALAERYNQGMGTTKNPLELLTPKSQETIRMLSGVQNQTTRTNNQITEGTTATNPQTGEQVIFRSGTWQKMR